MKTIFIILLTLPFVFLSSCNIEDTPTVPTPADFSSNIRDYVLSGDKGKTYTFVTTTTDTDTNGTVTITHDTTLWAVVNPHATHPTGGSAIEYTRTPIVKGIPTVPITYYLVVNDSMLAAYQGTSESRTIYMKAPLVKGTTWKWSSSTSPEFRIIQTGEKLTLPTGVYATVSTEASYIEPIGTDNKKVTHTMKNYLAQGVIFCKLQEDIVSVYVGGKKATRSQVMELQQVK